MIKKGGVQRCCKGIRVEFMPVVRPPALLGRARSRWCISLQTGLALDPQSLEARIPPQVQGS